MPCDMFIDYSPEIAEARNAAKAVVALESTIISHGLPYPQNCELAQQLEQVVRAGGAVPATIGIVGGRLKIGLNIQEIEMLAKSRTVHKVSRRDFATIIALEENGATTVCATMMAAHMAGIRIFATGGIGGVHRNGETTMDISADLMELARTRVAVVCAGAKSILDLPKTLEVLESNGVPVLGYQTGVFPAFHTRDSGLPVDMAIQDCVTISKILKTRDALETDGGEIIANPIPAAYAMDRADLDGWIESALQAADNAGIKGKESTPFLLAKIAALSGGRTIDANRELVLNNARLAAKIAVAYHAEI